MSGLETLAVRGLEEHVRLSLIFAIIVSFVLFTVFTLIYVLYFNEFLIQNSRGFMILNVDFALKLSNYTSWKRFICLK